MNYNPYLAQKNTVDVDSDAGNGYIEKPSDMHFNFIYQTRAAAPTDYENSLCDAVQELFLEDVTDLSGLVLGLNKKDVKDPQNMAWTEASFEAAMLDHNADEE